MAGKNYTPVCILTEGSKIKKIGRDIGESENSDGIVLDAHGGWVLPGLIDAHSTRAYEEKKGRVGDSLNETTETDNAVYQGD